MANSDIALFDLVSVSQELPLNELVNDGSNPFNDDFVFSAAASRRRLVTPVVNGSDADPDTLIARRSLFVRLNRAYVAATALSVDVTVFASRALGTHTKATVRAYAVGTDGVATGANLVTTAEQTFQGQTTPTVLSFAINPASLVPGSKLCIEIEFNLNDTGVAGGSADATATLSRALLTTTAAGGLDFFQVL
ncbi:MAG: hypothetical protein ACKVZJ_10160 [Phycisphaerales bacterium]